MNDTGETILLKTLDKCDNTETIFRLEPTAKNHLG